MDALSKYSSISKEEACIKDHPVINRSSQYFDGRSVSRAKPSLVTSSCKASADQCHKDHRDYIVETQSYTASDNGTEELIGDWGDLDVDNLPAFTPKIEPEPEPESKSDDEGDDFFSYKVGSNQYQTGQPLASANYLYVQNYEDIQCIDQVIPMSTTIHCNIREIDLPVTCPITESIIIDKREYYAKKIVETFFNELKNIAHNDYTQRGWLCQESFRKIDGIKLTDSEKNRIFLYSEFLVESCQYWLPNELITVFNKLLKYGIIRIQEDDIELIESAKIRLSCALFNAINNNITKIDSENLSYLICDISRLVYKNNEEMLNAISAMLAALLSSINRESKKFNINNYSRILWSFGNLLKRGLKPFSGFNETLNMLFSCIHDRKSCLYSMNFNNIMWSIRHMLPCDVEQSEEFFKYTDELIKLTPTRVSSLTKHGVVCVVTSIVRLVEHEVVSIRDKDVILAIKCLASALVGYEDCLKVTQLIDIIKSYTIVVELKVDPDLAKELKHYLELSVNLLCSDAKKASTLNRQGCVQFISYVPKLIDVPMLNLKYKTSHMIYLLNSSLKKNIKKFSFSDIVDISTGMLRIIAKNELMRRASFDVLVSILNQIFYYEDNKEMSELDCAKLLWVIASLGTGIKNCENFVRMLIIDKDFNQISKMNDIRMMLWSFTCFYSRNTIKPSLKHVLSIWIKIFMKKAEEDIPNIGSKEGMKCIILLRMSSLLLGIKYDQKELVFNHKESYSHKLLLEILRSEFPKEKIESEVGKMGLSPVDIILYDYMVIIECQGPSHFFEDQKEFSNGKTLLKLAAYNELGFTSFEISTPIIAGSMKVKMLLKKVRNHIKFYKMSDSSINLTQALK